MRRLLAGSALAALLAVAAAAPAWGVADTTAVRGRAVSITFHPFTIPFDTGCVRWAEDGSFNCDPVNLVFVGRSPAQVSALLAARGWTVWDLGSAQQLHFATPMLYAQDAQVFLADGRNAAGQTTRYHVRLWAVRGAPITVTVGAVHHEARTGLFSDTIDRSWDAAEAFVAGSLCEPACRSTQTLTTQRRMQGGAVMWRDWANDAVATIVPRRAARR